MFPKFTKKLREIYRQLKYVMLGALTLLITMNIIISEMSFCSYFYIALCIYTNA